MLACSPAIGTTVRRRAMCTIPPAAALTPTEVVARDLRIPARSRYRMLVAMAPIPAGAIRFVNAAANCTMVVQPSVSRSGAAPISEIAAMT